MGTENRSQTPSSAAPPSTPFVATSSISRPPSFGSMPYTFRPTPPEPPLTATAPSEPVGHDSNSKLFPASDPSRPSNAFSSPIPWNSQGFSSTTTVTNPLAGQQPRRPAVGSVFSPHIPGHPQGPLPMAPIPKGSPAEGAKFEPLHANTYHPPPDFTVSDNRPSYRPLPAQPGTAYTSKGGAIQPVLPGYPTRQPYPAPQYINPQPPFGQQGNYIPSPGLTPFPPPQGAQSAPMAASTSVGPYSKGYAESVNSEFPTGSSFPGLVEEFGSLTLEAVPGSMNLRVDTEALPRPLDQDVKHGFASQMFPMNCNSRYFRFTTSGIPNSQSLLSRWHLPLGAVVCPLAEPEEEDVPVLNFASTGIIRCRRCRTYVNPYVIFTDGGRKWRCNICSFLNDVPGDYFATLGADGLRVDLEHRPELTKGSIEFIAPTEYMVRPPMPPLYFFLIDVSMSAVKSGMVESVAQTIKSCLNDLPGFPRTQIGFITYDSTVHFYNMKSSLTQPQMIVVSDLDDVFVPLPDDLLVNLSDSRCVVDAFLDTLPSMFKDNENLESAFGPALKAAFMVMNPLGGKLLIFQNTLPSLGVGRLRLRGDDLRVYGTDKEHTLRISEDPFYKQMAADLTKFQIGVNIYAFSDKYTDIASLGTLAKYTGGQVYYYPGFRVSIHGEKLKHELTRDLTRETAWEAVMRIRCGKGVRFTTYHGHFMLRSTDLLALPAVDCDKAFAMQLSLEETLLTTQTTYFQVALLYTSSSGERRIRVHTAAAPVVTELGEMYRQADTGAIVSLLCRLAIEKTLTHKLEDARNSVQQRVVKALREYRNLYAVQHRLGGRMIYPESLKFLPLYGLALYKAIPLRGGYTDANLDERCSMGYTMMALPVKQLLKLLYPSLIRIDENLSAISTPNESNHCLKRSPLIAESLNSNGLFVYDNGLHFILWFGRMFPPDLVMNILGVDFAVDLSKVIFRERENAMSRKLVKILDKLREEDLSYYQVCHIVRQGDQPREGLLLLANLVEEQAMGTNGYADWMLQLHRQVLQNA